MTNAEVKAVVVGAFVQTDLGLLWYRVQIEECTGIPRLQLANDENRREGTGPQRVHRQQSESMRGAIKDRMYTCCKAFPLSCV
jgi:hypothetical protein